jgi:uncharacterized membrane protein
MWTPLIAVHAISASLALLFGAHQLLKRGGGRIHRTIGYVWIASMYVVCATSFGIQTLNGGFGWLHGLSAFTILTVTVGLVAAIKRKIKAHKSFMRGSYFGLLGALIGVIVVPSRRIPEMVMENTAGFILWVEILLVAALFTIFGVMQFFKQKDLSVARKQYREKYPDGIGRNHGSRN